MLVTRQFKKLNSEIESQEMLQHQSPAGLEEFHEQMMVFAYPNSQLFPFFDSWVKYSPAHYAPYLARGIYKTEMGWKARGEKWIQDTSKGRLSTMGQLFHSAAEDLGKAKSIKPDLLPAYTQMLSILANYNAAAEVAVYKEGLKHFPNSLLLRMYRLNALRPNWGGSIQAMSQFIETAKPFYAKNPRLRVLEGTVDQEIGFQYALKGNYKEALNHFDRALEFGDFSTYMYQRGDALLRLGKTDEAIKVFTRVLEKYPLYLVVWTERAHAYFKLKDYKKARSDYLRSFRIYPNDALVAHRIAMSSYYLHKYADAVRYNELALRYDPGNKGYLKNSKIYQRKLKASKVR